MTPITEVPARAGHRRWVYGRLDPAREPVIKLMPLAFPADTFLRAFASVTVLQHALMFGRFPVIEVPGMEGGCLVDPQNPKGGCVIKNVESSTLSVDMRRTAAEYRAQGIA